MTTDPIDLGRVETIPVELTSAEHEQITETMRALPGLDRCWQLACPGPECDVNRCLTEENETYFYSIATPPAWGRAVPKVFERFPEQFVERLPAAEADLLQMPPLMRWEYMRGAFWLSTLPVFEAWRLWQFVDDVVNRNAFKLLHAAAREVLAEYKLAEPTNERCDALATAVMKHTGLLRSALKLTGEPPVSNEAAAARAAELNEGFAAYLARLGKTGAQFAAGAREMIAEGMKPNVWRWWHVSQDRAPLFLPILLKVLWADQVEAQLTRTAYRRPAVVRAVSMDRLLPMMTRQTQFPELDDDSIRDDKGRVLANVSLTTNTTIEMVRRGGYALGTVPGNRLIRSLIHRSHDAWNRGENDPRRVAFEGGWSGLVKAIGASEKAQLTLVKEIVHAGQCIVWTTPHLKAGGLWTWSERRGSKAGTGEVAFVLGDALTPGFGEQLKRTGGNSLPARIARRLVPELRYEPPMGGARELDHGRIWTLHRLLLVELVDRAEKLHTEGAVVITAERWRELARQAGVATSIVDRTLGAWVAGESETAPALLERVDRDSWTLAKPHAPERDFIKAGGESRVLGRAAKAKGRRRRRRSP
jgi:hypothetical protein